MMITAAHVVYGYNQIKDDVWFYCGQHGNDASFSWKALVKNMFVPKAYQVDVEEFDIALCGLFITEKD